MKKPMVAGNQMQPQPTPQQYQQQMQQQLHHIQQMQQMHQQQMHQPPPQYQQQPAHYPPQQQQTQQLPSQQQHYQQQQHKIYEQRPQMPQQIYIATQLQKAPDKNMGFNTLGRRPPNQNSNSYEMNGPHLNGGNPNYRTLQTYKNSANAKDAKPAIFNCPLPDIPKLEDAPKQGILKNADSSNYDR